MTPAVFTAMRAYATGVGPTSGDVDAAYVTAAHGACLDVHPYTVDDPDEMRALLDAGVDGMCTNVPDALRRTINQSHHRTPPAHCH
jgi:glycerophosphoryl diester phosphodiesterase